MGGDAQCLWSSFLRGERNGAMRSDSTSCNAVTAVSKDVARNNVEESDHKNQDSRCEDQSPESQAQRLLASGSFVHISENIQAEDNHRNSKSDEPMAWAEQRPIARVIGAEEGQFGGDEEHASYSCNDMAHGVEEEEPGHHRRFNKHHDARCNDSHQDNNVHHAEDIKNDVAWACQRLGGESHLSDGS